MFSTAQRFDSGTLVRGGELFANQDYSQTADYVGPGTFSASYAKSGLEKRSYSKYINEGIGHVSPSTRRARTQSLGSFSSPQYRDNDRRASFNSPRHFERSRIEIGSEGVVSLSSVDTGRSSWVFPAAKTKAGVMGHRLDQEHYLDSPGPGQYGGAWGDHRVGWGKSSSISSELGSPKLVGQSRRGSFLKSPRKLGGGHVSRGVLFESSAQSQTTAPMGSYLMSHHKVSPLRKKSFNVLAQASERRARDRYASHSPPRSRRFAAPQPSPRARGGERGRAGGSEGATTKMPRAARRKRRGSSSGGRRFASTPRPLGVPGWDEVEGAWLEGRRGSAEVAPGPDHYPSFSPLSQRSLPPNSPRSALDGGNRKNNNRSAGGRNSGSRQQQPAQRQQQKQPQRYHRWAQEPSSFTQSSPGGVRGHAAASARSAPHSPLYIDTSGASTGTRADMQAYLQKQGLHALLLRQQYNV